MKEKSSIICGNVKNIWKLHILRKIPEILRKTEGWEYVRGIQEPAWKSSQWPNLEQLSNTVNYIVLDYNPKYEISICEFLLINDWLDK